jgi:hypothetical protein
MQHVSVQDRTYEFQQAVVTFSRQNKPQQAQSSQGNGNGSGSSGNGSKSSANAFNRQAGQVARHIVRVTGALTKLAQLAKKKQLFGDKPTDIIELTYVIKQDIFKIEKELKDLKALQMSTQRGKKDSKNASENQVNMFNKNVMQLLNTRTKNISENFKQVLQERQRSEMLQRSRQEQLLAAVKSTVGSDGMLGAGVNAEGTGSQQGDHTVPYALRSANGHVNGSIGGGDGSGASASASASMGAGSDNPFLASMALADDNANMQTATALSSFANNANGSGDAGTLLSLPDQTQQLMLLEEQDNRYVQERSQAVDAIESTINEVGGLFQQLATMVQEQGEVIQRIDDNVDDVALNIGGAQRELMKYYKNVSSNRWLMLKIFGVLIVFFLLWVLVS